MFDMMHFPACVRTSDVICQVVLIRLLPVKQYLNNGYICSPNLRVCLQEPQCVPECQLSDLSDKPHLENSEAGMQLTSPPLTCCKPVSLLLWLHLLSGMDTVYMSIWGHTHTAPKGKLEVRGKRWH